MLINTVAYHTDAYPYLAPRFMKLCSSSYIVRVKHQLKPSLICAYVATKHKYESVKKN